MHLGCRERPLCLDHPLRTCAGIVRQRRRLIVRPIGCRRRLCNGAGIATLYGLGNAIRPGNFVGGNRACVDHRRSVECNCRSPELGGGTSLFCWCTCRNAGRPADFIPDCGAAVAKRICSRFGCSCSRNDRKIDHVTTPSQELALENSSNAANALAEYIREGPPPM